MLITIEFMAKCKTSAGYANDDAKALVMALRIQM